MSNLSKEYDEVVAQIKELDRMSQEINDEIESLPVSYSIKHILLHIQNFMLLSNIFSLNRDKMSLEAQERTRSLMREGSFNMDNSIAILEKSLEEESLIRDHIRSVKP
jgi:uncharacterized coiled-coil DUF342 family protein